MADTRFLLAFLPTLVGCATTSTSEERVHGSGPRPSGSSSSICRLLTFSLCLFLAWYFTYHVTQRPITRLVQESFVILGWVSMWKPIEIFLYEWLPLARRRRLFLRLSSANFTSRSSETH
jgi:hypothetical protein